jgi:hypothetical protein
VNIVYGTKWKAGIFAGQLKNFGASENNVGEIYAMAPDVDTMFKVSGLLSFNYKNFMVGAELSWNTAAYGDIDKSDFAKVKNAQKVTAFKNMIAVAYNF